MGKRRLSKQARAKMAAGGLASWRARADARAKSLENDVATFRTNLLAECGPNPSTSRLGLVEAATTTFAAIVRIRHVVIRSPKAEVAQLVERVSWLTGNLTRLLKQLNLDARPRPRTFADLFASKVEQTGQMDPAKGPESAPKSA